MARGPVIPTDIVERIEDLWAENPDKPVTEIHKETCSFRPRPSLRKTQLIIQAARLRGAPVPADPPIVPWGPDWPNNPEDIECLFTLLIVPRAVAALLEDGLAAMGLSEDMPAEPVDTRTAKWALRLRRYFDHGADLSARNSAMQHLYWAGDYARRERVSEVLGRPIRTADLDGVFMLRALDSDEHWERYLAAVEQGVVPKLNISQELDDAHTLDPDFIDILVAGIVRMSRGDQILEDVTLPEELQVLHERGKQDLRGLVERLCRDNPQFVEAAQRFLNQQQSGEHDGNESQDAE